MINKQGKSDKTGPLIHPDTGHEINKEFYVSVPYFPGLSEAFKKILKYTAVQVCFKGVKTLKWLLMHPKEKVPYSQKKYIVYQWECLAHSCSSSYIRETCKTLGERAKEHSKSSTSAIPTHCTDFHHHLPSFENFTIIDSDSSQIT